jgi:hypothetical protein
MRKKYLAVAILLLVFGATAFFLAPKNFFSRSGVPPSSTSTRQNTLGSGTAPTVITDNVANPSPKDLSAGAGQVLPPAPVATNVPPMVILQNAHNAIAQFAQVYGGNPVGVNSEITAALMGNNPKHINFITPDSGLTVNTNGEMVDAWGTPLFFHQLSGHDTEIHSAGEDRKMWTFDDLVIH